MTAAAGFSYHDGIVLCADTLLSGGIVNRHVSKIGGFRFKDGVVLFALAGDTDMAEAAIQQCEDPLQDYSGSPRKRSELARIVRDVLGAEYKTHIIDNGYEGGARDYAMIIALHSEANGLGLYATRGTQLKRSRSGCEVIGSGETHAFMAVQRFGGNLGLKHTNAQRASLVAAYAIGQAKHHQQGSVGGESVIIHLEPDGMVSSAHGCNEPLTEKYAEKFHKDNDFLMTLFLDLARSEQFSFELDKYPERLRKLSEDYRNEVSTTFYLGPLETGETMWEINTPEYLSTRRAKKGAQGRWPQPPSPESHGETDES